MARKKSPRKSASRAESRAASQKKIPSRKAAKAKAAKAKAAKANAAKTNAKAAVKSSARKKLASRGRAPAPVRRTRRPKQCIAISHYRNEDFKADGLRAYAQYRDLGFADATSGLAQAHVIRLIGPCNPDEVSKLHYHDVEFQMVYVLKGWVRTYMEGQGETLMQQGSAWTQPPRIRHLVMDYSDDVELLEVILPAKFRTVELTA